jgi:glycosyltransferase involved in cell wall biosynthesis
VSDQQATTATLDVSVVIPAYRRPELLRKAVTSALSQDMASDRFEVIVVDSSPDDVNAQLIEEMIGENRGASLRILRKPPEGPGPSRMLGAEQAQGRVIAFLDSDCQAQRDWLAAGLAEFREGIGIVQGKTMPDPGQTMSTFCRSLQIEAENPRYEAANIFYLRDCLADAGKPNIDYTPNDDRPTGGEDALMAWRIKRKGWGSSFAEEALVYHEIIPISVWHWFYEKRMVKLPWLVREIPEMKEIFFLGYFFDIAHACLTLLLLGVALSPFSPFWLVACIPYVVVRASEPTRSLRGVRRILRALIYLPRDLLAFGVLLVGSLRYRTLLL